MGLDRRNAQASWGDYRGGKRPPPKKICSKMQRSIAKILAPLATSAIASRYLARRGPAPSVRAADCLPQGGTPPPARPFHTAPRVSRVLSLSISATSATLICTIVFRIVFLSSLLGRSWRLLSPLDRLLGSLGLLFGPPGALLAASWSLLRRSWGGLGASWSPLGPSWRRSQPTQKYDAKQDRFWTLKRSIPSHL